MRQYLKLIPLAIILNLPLLSSAQWSSSVSFRSFHLDYLNAYGLSGTSEYGFAYPFSQKKKKKASAGLGYSNFLPYYQDITTIAAHSFDPSTGDVITYRERLSPFSINAFFKAYIAGNYDKSRLGWYAKFGFGYLFIPYSRELRFGNSEDYILPYENQDGVYATPTLDCGMGFELRTGLGHFFAEAMAHVPPNNFYGTWTEEALPSSAQLAVGVRLAFGNGAKKQTAGGRTPYCGIARRPAKTVSKKEAKQARESYGSRSAKRKTYHRKLKRRARRRYRR